MPMGTKKKLPKGNAAQSRSKVSSAAKGPAAAYEKLLSAARALSAAPVSHLSPSLCRANVQSAMKAVAPYLGDKKKTGSIDVAKIARLPDVATAFEYAESRVPKEGSDGAIEKALATISPLRTATLGYLESAAFCGLVDAGRVNAIRAGKGKLDVAKDAVAIAGLFADNHGALMGRHPFTPEQLETLAAQGAWLAERLKPTGTVRDKKERTPEALVKDRFAALLEDGYAELEKLAVNVWGVAHYRDHVPALRSQAHAPRAKSPAQTATAAATASLGAT